MSSEEFVLNDSQSIFLHQLVRLGQVNDVISYCEAGKNLEIRDDFGNTALIIAAELNNMDLLKILVANGAELNVENDFQLSPRLWAEKNNNQAMIELIDSLKITQITTNRSF